MVLMDIIYLLFLFLSWPIKVSSVSVEFDFNAPHNAIVPMSLMSHPFDWKWIDVVNCFDNHFECHHAHCTTWAWRVSCLSSMLHSTMLPQVHLSCSLDYIGSWKTGHFRLLFLCLRLRSSKESVVLMINASYIDLAPNWPKEFSAYCANMWLSFMMIIFLSLWLPFRLSTVRVEFTINASHNDLIPVSPILFPVDINWQKNWWVNAVHLSKRFLL